MAAATRKVVLRLRGATTTHTPHQNLAPFPKDKFSDDETVLKSSSKRKMFGGDSRASGLRKSSFGGRWVFLRSVRSSEPALGPSNGQSGACAGTPTSMEPRSFVRHLLAISLSVLWQGKRSSSVFLLNFWRD